MTLLERELAKKLADREAAIKRVRELADTWMSDGAAWGPYSARCILDALDGGVELSVDPTIYDSARLEAEVVNLSEEAVLAKAAIARVRELHNKHDPNCPYGEDCAGAGLCLACREEYPCATIRALEGDNDVLH